METPPPPTETKQTVLRRLLRRRGRSAKPRANSREPVKSWGEYSDVTLHPTGSPSRSLRWIVWGFAIFCILVLAGSLLASLLAAETIFSVVFHLFLLSAFSVFLFAIGTITFSPSGDLSPRIRKLVIATSIVILAPISLFLTFGVVFSVIGLFSASPNVGAVDFMTFGMLSIVAGRIVMEIID